MGFAGSKVKSFMKAKVRITMPRPEFCLHEDQTPESKIDFFVQFMEKERLEQVNKIGYGLQAAPSEVTGKHSTHTMSHQRAGGGMHHPPHNFVCLALLGQVEPPRLGREYDRTRALLSIRAARVNDRKPEPENCRAGASSARTPFSSHMELPMHPLMSVVAMGLLSERKHPMLHVSPGTLTVAITVRASGTQVESKSAMRQNKTLTSPAKHGWDTRGACGTVSRQATPPETFEPEGSAPTGTADTHDLVGLSIMIYRSMIGMISPHTPGPNPVARSGAGPDARDAESSRERLLSLCRVSKVP